MIILDGLRLIRLVNVENRRGCLGWFARIACTSWFKHSAHLWPRLQAALQRRTLRSEMVCYDRLLAESSCLFYEATAAL